MGGLREFLSQNGADLRRSRFGRALALLPGLFLCLAALSFGGCAGVATRFTPYSGSAAGHPGNRRGAFVEQVKGIPVYYSEPDRPYRILGVLHVAKRGPRPLAHSIFTHKWMEEVRKLGGNAVWILTEQREIAGYSGFGSAQTYNWGMFSSTTQSSVGVYPAYIRSGEVLVLRLVK
ncbi:hypothetical protein kam1_240 [Methylacidiphilum kamchatkense Kam1]|uniref:Uncharacterized protein n=1 Tax=Methylacidiphilum kamchatkense Kam1 TaxID=1202785 RepID=A0A516TJU2_9BACT|nr:hypothetical protein kam1_240 [Methylacidiphilum kamchatkense Kam1]